MVYCTEGKDVAHSFCELIVHLDEFSGKGEKKSMITNVLWMKGCGNVEKGHIIQSEIGTRGFYWPD